MTFREVTSGVECRHWFEKPQQSPTVESLGSVDALVIVTLVNKIPILALLHSLSPLEVEDFRLAAWRDSSQS